MCYARVLLLETAFFQLACRKNGTLDDGDREDEHKITVTTEAGIKKAEKRGK